MQLNNLFKRSKPAEETKEAQVQAAPEPTKSCPRCQTELTSSQLEAQHYVCSCGYHFRMPARKRLMNLVDEGSFWELDSDCLLYTSFPLFIFTRHFSILCRLSCTS